MSDRTLSITATDSNPEGHNQYTGGSARVMSSSSKSPAMVAFEAEKIVRNKEIFKKEIAAQNFPMSRVTIQVYEKKFSVGGVQMSEGGHIDFKTGQIVLNAGGGALYSTGLQVRQVVAHEVGHAIFERALNPKNLKEPSWTPTTVSAALKPFIDYHNTTSLEKEDGVTPYSKKYWKIVNSEKSFHSALHETFAEIHAGVSVKGEKFLDKVGPVWQDLYRAVSEQHSFKKAGAK